MFIPVYNVRLLDNRLKLLHIHKINIASYQSLHKFFKVEPPAQKERQ